MKEFDFLIIGQGIAGTVMAYRLMKAGKSVLILDEAEPYQSSSVAAGMYNAISGKRMTLSWKWEETFLEAKALYSEIGELLGKNYLFEKETFQSFGNIKEQNDFSLKAEDELFQKHIRPTEQKFPAIRNEFGSFIINSTGWLQTHEFLKDFKEYAIQQQQLKTEQIDWSSFQHSEEGIKLNGYFAKQVISCEGWKLTQNPLFNFVPLIPTKGDVFLLKCDELPDTFIWKKGVYLVPLGNGIFKAGSTYRWNVEELGPDKDGYEELYSKVEAQLQVPFEVLEHLSGFRPASKNRYPIIGAHPIFKNLFAFNGLGTRGIMLAPYVSKQLVDHILVGTEIEPAIQINRYYPKSSQ